MSGVVGWCLGAYSEVEHVSPLKEPRGVRQKAESSPLQQRAQGSSGQPVGSSQSAVQPSMLIDILLNWLCPKCAPNDFVEHQLLGEIAIAILFFFCLFVTLFGHVFPGIEALLRSSIEWLRSSQIEVRNGLAHQRHGCHHPQSCTRRPLPPVCCASLPFPCGLAASLLIALPASCLSQELRVHSTRWKHPSSDSRDDECALCLVEFEVGDEVRAYWRVHACSQRVLLARCHTPRATCNLHNA